MAEDLWSKEAIAAREADIMGKPQRIPELAPEDIDGAARELIATIRGSVGVTDNSHIPGYFRTMVKHPAIFRTQLAMGTAIFRGEIPPRERELAVVRIGWLNRAPYEFGEHVDIAKRYGITAEEIEYILVGSTHPHWNAHEAAVLRGVEQLLASQMIDDATWATLAETWSEAQLIEFPMMVGQYVATAYVQNALRMTLASDNPGLTYR
jgi:alkylhydroperoxidase family enzyme